RKNTRKLPPLPTKNCSSNNDADSEKLPFDYNESGGKIRILKRAFISGPGTNSRIQVKRSRNESSVVSVLIEQKTPYMIDECNSIGSNIDEETEAFTQVNEPIEPSAIIWLPRQNENTGAFRIGANDVLMGINRNNSYIEDTSNSITEQENASNHVLAFDTPS
ncbi:17505_t:CDS:2, partial [Racocetra fulgida]